MRFVATPLAGVWEILMEPQQDERGWFARAFCAEEFARHGLASEFPQHNSTCNRTQYTLRGLHGTLPSHPEAKMVRCVAGAVWDVAVDARPASSTFGRWHGVELTAANRRMLYLPAGCLHGYLTLMTETELFYLMSAPYQPEAAWGVRWDDPILSIAWPAPPEVISSRDAALPGWDEALTALRGGPT